MGLDEIFFANTTYIYGVKCRNLICATILWKIEEKRVGNLVIFFYCLNLKTNLIDKSILFQIAMTNVSLCLMSLSVNWKMFDSVQYQVSISKSFSIQSLLEVIFVANFLANFVYLRKNSSDREYVHIKNKGPTPLFTHFEIQIFYIGFYVAGLPFPGEPWFQKMSQFKFLIVLLYSTTYVQNFLIITIFTLYLLACMSNWV